MMTEAETDLMERLVAHANAEHDGHLSVLKFTTNWRVGFGTPYDRHDIDMLAEGETFAQAARKALAFTLADTPPTG